MAKLLPGQLEYVPRGPIPDPSSTRKRNTNKTTSKELEDDFDSLNKPIEKINIDGPGVGQRFAIRVKELDTENDYDNIEHLNDRLNDTSLSHDEATKIIYNIYQIKLNIPKQELNKLKNI